MYGYQSAFLGIPLIETNLLWNHFNGNKVVHCHSYDHINAPINSEDNGRIACVTFAITYSLFSTHLWPTQTFSQLMTMIDGLFDYCYCLGGVRAGSCAGGRTRRNRERMRICPLLLLLFYRWLQAWSHVLDGKLYLLHV